MESSEGWRHLTPGDRSDFLNDVYIDVVDRQECGERTYGNEFAGEPLAHAWEEGLDQLFYIWMARRRHKILSDFRNMLADESSRVGVGRSDSTAAATHRPTFDETFLEVARVISLRSTCPRAQVGAVLVKDGRILATGYNGAASGEPHCTEVGCLMENGHCQRAIHAETNAVGQAARLGTLIGGATMYFWDSQGRSARSCTKCWQTMTAAGISHAVSPTQTLTLPKEVGE